MGWRGGLGPPDELSVGADRPVVELLADPVLDPDDPEELEVPAVSRPCEPLPDPEWVCECDLESDPDEDDIFWSVPFVAESVDPVDERGEDS